MGTRPCPDAYYVVLVHRLAVLPPPSVQSVPAESGEGGFPDNIFIRPQWVVTGMFGKSNKKTETEAIPPFGGLEYDIPDEVILKDIEDYSYVMGKLKDC